MKLKMHDLISIFWKKIFGDDDFQNMFVYQPTLNTLELYKEKGTKCDVGWNSKVVYTSNLTPL